MSLHLAAQEGACGTTMEDQRSTLDFIESQRAGLVASPRQGGVFEVPVQFHIIGATNGAFAIDSAIILDELAEANEFYLEANIQLVHCGPVNFIYNNSVLTFVKGEDEWLCDQHDVPNVINVYFVPNLEDDDGDDLCGYAYNIDVRPRVLMENSCSFNGSTLTHEFGHSFSLLHTHSSSNGDELVNGSNCQVAGDLLCDTPADPRLSSDVVNSNCVYTGEALDANQMPYDPDTGNFMSYSRKVCRDHFSAEQRTQMQDYFALEGGFLVCDLGMMTNTREVVDPGRYVVHPNPSSTTWSVRGLDVPSQLQLYSQEGRLLWTGKSTQGATDFQLPLLGDLPAGLYQVRIYNEQGFSTHKVVKI